ncbi:pilus assembly FimT family protein [Polynucleobacter acidiphobus]|uniref:pilus assembly FimT family protein n=1 Tax=Polynucleobacter acidiphobus TaxID=556053 RepID=UPI000D3B88BF|nr:GspH/FimT family pseudopilin [Polynucleobacter acidiphobus]
MSSNQKWCLFDSRGYGEQGYTLLELMVVIALISLLLMFGVPQIQTQFYERELEHATRQFIYHAQFARQRALYGGRDMFLKPRATDDDEANWNSGWQLEGIGLKDSPEIIVRHSLPANIAIHSKGFVDPHSGQSQIRFNPAGAAKSKHGGFVANRLVFTHTKNADLQRHVILAASGRWRICNPNSAVNRKGLGC